LPGASTPAQSSAIEPLSSDRFSRGCIFALARWERRQSTGNVGALALLDLRGVVTLGGSLQPDEGRGTDNVAVVSGAPSHPIALA